MCKMICFHLQRTPINWCLHCTFINAHLYGCIHSNQLPPIPTNGCSMLAAFTGYHNFAKLNVSPRLPNINKANLRDLIAATGLVITNWIQIVNFSTRGTMKFDGWSRKTIGQFCYTTSRFVDHFKSIGEFKLDFQSRNTQFGSKLVICYPIWPWNLMDDLGKQ